MAKSLHNQWPLNRNWLGTLTLVMSAQTPRKSPVLLLHRQQPRLLAFPLYVCAQSSRCTRRREISSSGAFDFKCHRSRDNCKTIVALGSGGLDRRNTDVRLPASISLKPRPPLRAAVAAASWGTVRHKLFKIGTLVTTSVRRKKIAMASGCP
jgi:hypothetical protein